MGGLHSGGLALAKIVNVVDGFALQICWHIYLCALPVRSSRLDFISSLAAFFFFPLFFFLALLITNMAGCCFLVFVIFVVFFE